MSCQIIEGATLDCRQGAGGVGTFYLTEWSNVGASGVTDSSGIVSLITMQPGKKFWEFQVEMEDAVFTEDPTPSIENGTVFYNQTLTFSIFKWTAKNRNIVRLLTQNRLIAVVKDMDDVYKVAGQKRALHLTAAPTSTGKASGDKNGYTITLTAKEPVPASMFTTASIITSLL